jgi:hypothetical protein
MEVQGRLQEHWAKTLTTTGLDARHSVTFGMASYALALLAELVATNLFRGALARLTLRTLLEIRITLRYLISKDQKSLWSEFRKYGAGQAKLASLKFDEKARVPTYINPDVLQLICNVDKW